MGTKRNPKPNDCYAKAHPDEPMFVLLGRDPYAPILVGAWAEMRRTRGCSTKEETDEAEECAEAMRQWALQLGKEEKLGGATDDMIALVRRTSAILMEASGFVHGTHSCPRSITFRCWYDPQTDPGHNDHCIFCQQPEERK